MDERCDTSDVRGSGVLDHRGCEGLCTVCLNVHDVGSGEIFGDKSEFLLNAGVLEERSGLAICNWELVAGVVLGLKLEEGDWESVSASAPTF